MTMNENRVNGDTMCCIKRSGDEIFITDLDECFLQVEITFQVGFIGPYNARGLPYKK